MLVIIINMLIIQCTIKSFKCCNVKLQVVYDNITHHSITSSKHRHRLRGCLSDVKLVATGFNGKTYKELDIFPSSYVLGLFQTRPHRQGDCQASSFSDQLYVDNVTLRLSGTSFPPNRTALPNFMFAI